MNILVIILIALIVGVVAIGAALSAIFNWIGRNDLGRKACIPQELASGVSQHRNTDHERKRLTNYSPLPTPIPIPRPHAFVSCIRALSEVAQEPLQTIDIGSLRELLNVKPEPPYSELFTRIGREAKYPLPPPQRIQIEQAPSWTPWEITFGEPSLELPYYTGILAPLNLFVDSAYSVERQHLAEAKAKRDKIAAENEQRNRELSELANRAESLRQAALDHQAEMFNVATTEYGKHVAAYLSESKIEQDELIDLRDRCHEPGETGLIARLQLAIKTMSLPPYVSRDFQPRYDSQSRILIHEHKFPDQSSIQWVKTVVQKTGNVQKPANKRETKEAASLLYPSLCLRLAAEIIKLDSEDLVSAVVVNGWADYTERATGKEARAYCASLFATKEQVQGLTLHALDPITAFNSLKGATAHSMELTPIAPIMRLDTSDSRFVDPKDVLDRLENGENLATMDWEDFEHLCRELFERAFSEAGAEVKVTQASRDQGVDAIIFDPDPLRGGKIVIQAKRYTNTVDVSAVRDLFGSVMNEGAMKGILVTTSHFGPDAYAFVKGKPITLLNGNELLGLLEQHGYRFRIDLEEAKRKMA